MRTARYLLTLCTLLLAALPAWAVNFDRKVDFAIAAQPLSSALVDFSRQAKVQVMSAVVELGDKRINAVNGRYSIREALQLLLTGTDLAYSSAGPNTVSVAAKSGAPAVQSDVSPLHASGAAMRLARVDDDKQGVAAKEDKRAAEDTRGIPEILVKGRRSLNTDIRRTEDDPQPYVVFESEEIRRSQAVNLQEFLKTRLPMNTTQESPGEFVGNSSPLSSIDLRGLGDNQTLVLVDGRRLPGVNSAFSPMQPDLNGIPLASIERIEVLPSTAGGIYGGSATGGVVNIIRRRDYRGIEVDAVYANTVDKDAGSVRVDASGGFSLEGGRTQVTISAAHTTSNTMTLGDRDFSARGIALTLRNNPTAIVNPAAPPLGATVNIRSVNGTNLVLDDGRPLNSPITHVSLGYAGAASDNGTALLANAGRYNLDLPAGVNGRGLGLVSAPAMRSAMMNVRREFTSWLEAFLDISTMGSGGTSHISNVPSSVANLLPSAPNNPFQQAIRFRYPTPNLDSQIRSDSTTASATSGLIARLPRNWMAELDYGWSRSRYETRGALFLVDSMATCTLGRGVALNVDPDGAGPLVPCAANDTRPALNALQEGNTFPIDFSPYELETPNFFSGPFDTELRNATLRFSGPTVSLPAGSLSLSALIERRMETIEDSFEHSISNVTRQYSYIFYPHRSQDVDSYYLEARVPLVALSQRLPGVRELELQLSARHDRYATMSHALTGIAGSPSGPLPAVDYATNKQKSTDYTVGLRYVPLEGLMLRASFGTGFLPASVTQIAPNISVGALNRSGNDPKRGGTPMFIGQTYTFISGGSPNLRPELSESLSAGAVFTPRFAPGLRLSIDYTRIEKVDEIRGIGNQFLLDNEDVLPGRIERGAKLAGEPANWAGPITLIDVSLINLTRTEVSAVDIQFDYMIETAERGSFRWYAIATRQPSFKSQVLPNSPMINTVGYSGGPLEWRGNFGLDWDRGPWTVSWNSQLYDSYSVYSAGATFTTPGTAAINQGSDTIPGQSYHDVIATYRFDGGAGFMRGLLADSELSVGIQNVFDTSPPTIAVVAPTIPAYSTYGDPRLRRYSISLRKSFN